MAGFYLMTLMTLALGFLTESNVEMDGSVKVTVD